MSLVSVRGLTLRYGPRAVLDGASFVIGPRDRVGLVGPNGTGKSSLMKILAGQLEPDEGQVVLQRRAVAGYLPQEVAALPPLPLLDAVLSTVPGRARIEERLRAAEAALGEARAEAEQLELAGELAELHEELDHFEEHFGRARAEEILMGLGFSPEDLSRPTGELSGGWRMRAALGALLLQDPDLLLLDEPTNHLDVPTLEWFDGFLRATKKALVLVCHDREFLDRQIDRVLSFEPEGLRAYEGSYADYKAARALELAQLEAKAVRIEARRSQLQQFIDRFGAKNTKAAAAQSKRKEIERLEKVELPRERATVRFRFAEPPRSGKEVLRLRGVHKSFGARVVYAGVDAEIQRGQRVAVIGENGAGKTTLLRMVAGELQPDAGEIVLGHSVTLGYYAQHHTDTLDPSRTVLEEIALLAPDKPESWVRSVLGAFLFRGDDVDKPIGVLSGGERARVALARLIVAPAANFLVMDEPTNHLDLDSSETLIEALRSFAGTLLFVSHNRSFVNGLATHVWDVRGGRIEAFPGNLDDYRYHLAAAGRAMRDRGPAVPQRGGGPRREERGAVDNQSAARKELVRDAPPGGTLGNAGAESARERRRREAQERQRRAAAEGPIRREIAALEERIGALERRVKEAEAALADPLLYADFARARPHMEAFQAGKAELEELYARWEAAQARLAEAGRANGA